MSKSKILIVEDERITAEDLKQTLLSLGYEVSGIASSAESFYKCLQSEIPDLVLMDIFIKGEKDGIELAAEIKETFQIPVIYLTAYSDARILERARITEPFAYILKPFQERELHSNIEMTLHKNQMEKRISHLNEILKAIRDINQIIVRVNNPTELINKTCETLISTSIYSCTWIIRTTPKGAYIEAASAGFDDAFSDFVNHLEQGYIPECISLLNQSKEKILTIQDSNLCQFCPTKTKCLSENILISKIHYQGSLYGYLYVNTPKSKLEPEEEQDLFIEICEDLGLALNNLEQVHKQELMQQELRMSEEKFKTLYLNAPLPFQSLDSEGCFIEINPMWEKTLGYTNEEVIGKKFGDFLHPDYIESYSAAFPAFKNTGFLKDLQLALRKKSGEYIYASFEGSVGYYANGTFKQTYCVFKDITTQQKIEESLKESETHFRFAFDYAASSMCMLSLEGKFLKVNSAFVRLLEYNEVEVKQLHFNDITLPEDKDLSDNVVQNLLSGGSESISIEKRYISKSGKIKTAQVSVSLVHDDQKKPKFFIVHIVDLTTSKLAEAKQKESEEQLRTLINAMPDIVCFKDGKGRWLVANDFILNLFGLKGLDYVGKKDSELAEYSTNFRKPLLHCEETDENTWLQASPRRSDETIELPDGSKLIFDIIKIPSFTTKGERKSIVVVGRDITDRNRTEQELQKLSQVVEQSPDSIIVTDTNGTIEYVNPATCLISGYSSKELIGNNTSVLNSRDIGETDFEEIWTLLRSGSEWKGTFKNKSKTGKQLWQKTTISPIKNQSGKITHFLSLQEDNTEQKHIENIQQALYGISKQAFELIDLKQLFENIKNELSQLFDTSNFYVAFYNEENDMLNTVYTSGNNDNIETWPAEKSLTGYVVKHNKSLLIKDGEFQELLQRGEVELIGQNSAIWMGVPLLVDGKSYGAFVLQNYTNPDAYTEKELRMLEFIASQVSISIQRQKSILDLKEALIKAEAGDKLKTAFINNISHEIRTPLNGILGFSEMIISNNSELEDNEIFYSIIKKSSNRLLNTVNSYMDISLIVSGTVEMSRRPTKIGAFLDELYKDFKELVEHKGLELKNENTTVEKELYLNTDPEKLRKIITHLLDNAVKFTKKGIISFGYSLDNLNIEFYVKDSGIGIEPDALNIIFNAFMQADISATRGYEGSGLGLTIANKLTHLLGGNIRVESTKDTGSTFFVSLPLSKNSIIAKTYNPEYRIEPTNSKPLILIAEDDDSNYKYIEIVLKYASFAVIRAENGIEAIELCRKNSDLKLILMDIKMPMMDGFEATRNIRTFMPHIPIIALTAYVTSEDENAAFAAGCDEYITKPVSKSRLLEIVNSAIAGNNIGC